MSKLSFILFVLCLSITMFGCRVEKKEEGNMPKVTVEGGNLPKYDVDSAKVNVTTENKSVTVPDIDIKKKETTVAVPKIDVQMPGEAGNPDKD